MENKDTPQGNAVHLEKWWKNHILLQHGIKWTNVESLDEHMNFCAAIRFQYARKWEAAIQEEYDLLMVNMNIESNHSSKGSQECRMQTCVPHPNGCIGPKCQAQGNVSDKGMFSKF